MSTGYCIPLSGIIAHHPRPATRICVVFTAILTVLITLSAKGQEKAADTIIKPVPAHDYTYAPAGKRPSVIAMTELGRSMFFDPSLSVSGKISCASCHSPAHAYGPPNNLSVQLGGKNGKTPGTRAVPSLRYGQAIPSFTEHFYDNDGDDSRDQGPAGGHNWDGRVNSAHEQARAPLFSIHEMGNRNTADLVASVRKSRYAGSFRAAFGDQVFDEPERALRAILMALEVFQESPADFYPYSSKYDAYLRGKAKLSQQEMRGLSLFNNPRQGNCAACHPSAITASGGFPAFTDYGFNALGVPRNSSIAANSDRDYYDMGLCGPLRTDLTKKKEYCGMFRTPSLRNTATRHAFFHNGVFHNLEQVLQFYAQRDTRPEKWYPHKPDGSVVKYNDLPPEYRSNVNTEAPFAPHAGNQAALSDADIRDIITFLHTLTDGYKP